jgi:hypothetical protein
VKRIETAREGQGKIRLYPVDPGAGPVGFGIVMVYSTTAILADTLSGSHLLPQEAGPTPGPDSFLMIVMMFFPLPSENGSPIRSSAWRAFSSRFSSPGSGTGQAERCDGLGSTPSLFNLEF